MREDSLLLDRRTTEVFEAAQLLPESERENYLREACADSDELLGRVEKLLRADRMLSDVFSEMKLVLDPPSKNPALDFGLSVHAAEGRYEDIEAIDAGGMGEVRLIRDPELRRELAKKTLLPKREGDVAARDRFIEEAQLTAQLAHPGVVAVHELGLDHEGKVYFTMERVEGDDLRVIYQKTAEGTDGWTPTRTLGALLKVCETLAFAHARGVIHRDLKPANIMIGAFGEVYVMDWGIAKIVGSDEVAQEESGVHRPPVTSDRGTATDVDASKLTMEGQIMGTAAYMSPEQARGNISKLDKRSDVYALGAMIYELLAGAPPYEAHWKMNGALAIVMARQKGAPVALEHVAKGASPELVAICEKAMADEPEDRYSDMGEMAEDLHAYLEDRVVRAYRTGPIVELTKWVKRNRRLAATMCLVLIAAVSGLVGMSEVKAAEQAEGWERVLKLSGGKVATELLKREKGLWPPSAEGMEEKLSKWVESAERILASEEEHGQTIGELKRDLKGFPPVTGDTLLALELTDPTLQMSWQRDRLRALVNNLKELAPIVERIRNVRLPFARDVRGRSITSPEAKDRWARAAQGVLASKRYGDLQLKPQLGLLPIGPDPESELWEFWHLQSGTEPVRGADGKLVITAETGIVFVLLPGGDIKIGAWNLSDEHPLGSPFAQNLNGKDKDEEPVHPVELAPFLLSKYEMTQGQWQRIMNENSSRNLGDEMQGPTLPAINVTWFECEEALRRSALVFPTEAQYEYAARAGTTTIYPSGNKRSALEGFSNIADRSYNKGGGRSVFTDIEDGIAGLAQVGSLKPNEFGLHDMLGNAWSWCQDTYAPYDWIGKYAGFEHQPKDGLLLGGDAARNGGTIRGGSYTADASNARSSNRFPYNRKDHDADLGLRPARMLER